MELFEAWSRRTAPAVRAAVLGTKIVRLTMPGVTDVYQGSESFEPTLVDPDNRRSIDAEDLAKRLARLDDGMRPRDIGDEKLWVTSRALRVRRDHPGAFVGPDAGYRPLAASSSSALTFARTEGDRPLSVTVATRGAVRLQHLGGWGEHTLVLPPGRWHDVLSGRSTDGGEQPVADLLESLPVALLIPEEA